MEGTRCNGHNILPVGDIALPVSIVAHGDHCAVCPQTHRMTVACYNSHNILPVGDIALPVFIVAHGDHCAVCPQTDCVFVTSCNGHNISPVGDIALPLFIVAHSKHRAVCPQTKCVTRYSQQHSLDKGPDWGQDASFPLCFLPCLFSVLPCFFFCALLVLFQLRPQFRRGKAQGVRLVAGVFQGSGVLRHHFGIGVFHLCTELT